MKAAARPAQEPAGKREVRQQAHAVCRNSRDQLPLDIALQQIVLVLGGDERREPMPMRGPLRLVDLRGVQVLAPDMADLALPHEVVERAQGLLHGRGRIRPVQLVEIDPIGAQPPQAFFDRSHDVSARGAGERA